MSKKVSNYPSLKLSIFLGFVYLLIAFGVNYIAGSYVREIVSPPTVDLLQSFLPVINTSFIYNQIALLFWVIVIVLLIRSPRKIPFVVVSLSTLIITRSFFMVLTTPGHIINDQSTSDFIVSMFSYENDYFFSAHTAIPFLMTLLFWKNKAERILFLSLSIIFGTAVILGRMHYSVDVFAAFFITYGVYVFCKYFFKKDLHLFRGY